MCLMSSGEWTIENGQLQRDASTTQLQSIRQQLDQIRAAFPALSISRRLLRPVLLVTGHFPSAIEARLIASASGERHGLLLGQDHLILGDRLFPVDPDLSSALTGLLEAHVNDPAAVTGPEYVSLLAEPLLNGLLLDEVRRGSALSVNAPSGGEITAACGLRAKLYPYQAEGIAAMLLLSRADVGALLGDEMGLGKTLQAIALLALERERGQSLVVCPGSLMENWRREINEFAPDLTVDVNHGPDRGVLEDSFPSTDVVVTTYETATNDIAFLEEHHFNVVVLDEAQMVKNPDAARTSAMKRLRRRVGLAVTGTPFENSLVDLWSLAEFVHPGLLGRRDSFLASFPDESTAAERLGQIMGQVTIRRSVDEVALELPPLVQALRPMQMDSDLRARYDRVLESGSGLEVNTRLRVVAAHADETYDTFSESPKHEFLMIQLENILAKSEKALVFCDFRKTLERIEAMLRAKWPPVFVSVIDGQTERIERQLIVDSFSSFSGGGALLLNPKAAGVGLNITAANHVFHFSPNYNPAVTAQATKRAHRQKQDRPVFVHHMFYVGSVEERAAEIAESKVALAEAVDEGLRDE